ncbi:unannotated protein [freshwater metagenome]|uniref:Unannotated protein n=1 Tax=freshwater metagenome TaxID=449393 RepID=A0A6J6RZ88_9ZZZZ|nr:DUF192 domain-containing protein [Actinomycetota bacterium]MSZ72638.1 DUF192 domain-containing protein [Actinomycetota bacterium]MUH56816.1 DUF192 domain-containing protein [Actinomycetota bacterium]
MTAHSAWLVTDGRVLASADIANDRASRRKGLSGQTHIEGAFVIPNCRWVHTFGMRVAIDVAYLDADGNVIKTVQMSKMRLGVPVWHARTVIEAEKGAFARWAINVGNKIEVRDSDNNHDNVEPTSQ